MGGLQQAESNLIAATTRDRDVDAQARASTMKVLPKRNDNILHRKHGVHKKFKPAHADPTRRAVLVHLDRIEIVTQESAHVLKDAVLWLEEVYPGKEVQDQIALDIVRLLKHVQLGVRLADGFLVFVNVCDPSSEHAPWEASRNHVNVTGLRRTRQLRVVVDVLRYLVLIEYATMRLDGIPQQLIGALIVYDCLW